MKNERKQKTVKTLLRCAVGLLLFQATLAFGAAASSSSISLGFDYASGDYGTDQTTDSYQIPVTFAYAPNDRLDFSLVIPYVYQNNSATVVLGGTRTPVHHAGTGGGAGMGGMGSGTSASTVNVNDSQSGLGDITLTTGFVLMPEAGPIPSLRPLVYIKFPTADEDKGLGTGATDLGGGLSLAKKFGDWSTYVEALYIAPGSTTYYNPDNYWTYLASASYRLSERLNCGIDLSGATAAFDAGTDALEVQAKVSYWTSKQGNVGGYVAKGLSDGSADYGAGIYGTLSF